MVGDTVKIRDNLVNRCRRGSVRGNQYGETIGVGDVDYPEKRSFRRDSMSTF